MNENINLCEILKGHEGETFYTPICGTVKLKNIDEDLIYPLNFINVDNFVTCFTSNGKFLDDVKEAECLIFPSKDQRDWNKWFEEQNPKVSKTWSDTRFNSSFTFYELSYIDKDKDYVLTSTGISSIERSALALLKIHQLIEVEYGGNVTNEEWKNTTKLKWYFVPNIADLFDVMCSQNYNKKRNIAFHTEEQAKEFLKYPENFQLLKDYFMIE